MAGFGQKHGGDVERTTGEGWWTGWRRGGTAKRKRRRGGADREEGDVVGGEESIVAGLGDGPEWLRTGGDGSGRI